MKKLHLIWKLAFASLLVYIMVYGVLSAFGSYTPSQSGKIRYPMGLSITDVEVWRPPLVRLKIYKDSNGIIQTSTNFLGWMFLPLELLDRRYWHPTKSYFPTKNTEQGAAANP
jgi:hypothetical protein